mmetsp:Transcript_13100/g.18831  ORF Transcript_13100/g.18831 Transcript_13100/m.18831 type:complete len:165 (-) Transcript_13100:156-650(-)
MIAPNRRIESAMRISHPTAFPMVRATEGWCFVEGCCDGYGSGVYGAEVGISSSVGGFDGLGVEGAIVVGAVVFAIVGASEAMVGETVGVSVTLVSFTYVGEAVGDNVVVLFRMVGEAVGDVVSVDPRSRPKSCKALAFEIDTQDKKIEQKLESLMTDFWLLYSI